MNSADLTFLFEGENGQLPASFPLATVRLAIGATLAYPLVGDKVCNAVGGALSSLWEHSGKAYRTYMPHLLQKGIEYTGDALVKGVVVLDEVFDFANFGGTKDPQASIDKSLERLAQHDQPFSECCEFFADSAASLYIQNEEKIQSKASESINQQSYDWIGKIAKWFMGLSKDLIAQTIKANILHVTANLADQAYDAKHPFGDRQRNPFGRIISVIGVCLTDFEQGLADIENAPYDQQDDLFGEFFEELSAALLAKFFPKGAEDLQLFHHTIPVKLFKEFAWKILNQKLPELFETLYRETRPLETQHPGWQSEFEAIADGFEAEQMVTFPSTLFQGYLRPHAGVILDEQKPSLAHWLTGKGIQDHTHLAEVLVKYAQEFLLTKDVHVLKMGSFLEKYVMERLLFNLTQYSSDHLDAPLPQLLIQKWVEGDCFRWVQGCLSGHADQSQPFIKGALYDIQEPFGFHRKDRFPLPPTLLEPVWPLILQFQQTKLPELLRQGIPAWVVLSNDKKNQKAVANLLGDDALFTSCRKGLPRFIDQLIERVTQSEQSPLDKIAERFPDLDVSSDLAGKVEEQIIGFMEVENPTFKILLEFGKQCTEAFLLQLLADLHARYLDDQALSGIGGLFNDKTANEDEDVAEDFPTWLVREAASAFEGLAPDQFSQQEAEALKEAVKLHHAIRYADDPVQKKKDQAEFNKAWVILSPKFEQVCKKLLGTFGYTRAEKLPFPKPAQKLIWNMLHKIFPKVLFNESGWLLQMLLDKNALEAAVEALPHGNFFAKGCKAVTQDLVDHLPDWTDDKIDKVPEGIKKVMPEIEINDETSDSLLLYLRSFLYQTDSAYDPIWNLVEDYLESLLLKIVLRISHLPQTEWEKIKTLIENAREELMALEKLQKGDVTADGTEEILDEEMETQVSDLEMKEREITEQLAEELSQIFGLTGEGDLYGMPSIIRKPFLAQAKRRFAEGLRAIYHLDGMIRNPSIDEEAFEQHLPLSKVSATVLILTRYVLEKATDHLSSRDDEGTLEFVSTLRPSLEHWLEKLKKRNYQIAGLIEEAVDQEIATPYLARFFDFLDHHENRTVKGQIADWMAPFMTNHLASALQPILDKEKQNSPHFDKALLLALLPIATRHLRHLNQASLTTEGLTPTTYLEAAGNELHPDLLAKQAAGNAQSGPAPFYQNQTKLIFDLIFPNGKDDLIKYLPEMDVDLEQADLLWEMAQTTIATNLPLALDAIFNKEFLIELFNDNLEEVLEKLEQPVDLESLMNRVKIFFLAKMMAKWRNWIVSLENSL